MAKKLFTERNGGGKPRTSEELDTVTGDALLNLVSSRIEDEWFGLAFPARCNDGYAYAGTDQERLRRTMAGYGLPWPPELTFGPRTGEAVMAITDGDVFDILEYAYESVAKPREGSFHNYMGHMHTIRIRRKKGRRCSWRM